MEESSHANPWVQRRPADESEARSHMARNAAAVRASSIVYASSTAGKCVVRVVRAGIAVA